jgi:hypothetical protein
MLKIPPKSKLDDCDYQRKCGQEKSTIIIDVSIVHVLDTTRAAQHNYIETMMKQIILESGGLEL